MELMPWNAGRTRPVSPPSGGCGPRGQPAGGEL